MAIKSDALVTNVPNQSSTSYQWMDWYENLKDRFGKKLADSYFKQNWAKRGNINVVNEEMQNYFEKEVGLRLEQTMANEISGFSYDIGDTIADAMTMAKWSAIVVGGIIVVPIAIVLINVALSPNKTISAIKN